MSFMKQSSARHRAETQSHVVRNTTVATIAAGAAVEAAGTDTVAADATVAALGAEPAGGAAHPADAAVPQVVADPTRSAPGRGAWLHPRRECLERAERTRSFARAFRRAVDPAPLLTSW